MQLLFWTSHVIAWATPSFLLMGDANRWMSAPTFAMICGTALVCLLFSTIAGKLSRPGRESFYKALIWAAWLRTFAAGISLLGFLTKSIIFMCPDFATGIPSSLLADRLSDALRLGGESFIALFLATLIQGSLICTTVVIAATLIHIFFRLLHNRSLAHPRGRS